MACIRRALLEAEIVFRANLASPMQEFLNYGAEVCCTWSLGSSPWFYLGTASWKLKRRKSIGACCGLRPIECHLGPKVNKSNYEN
jgi:hypothetical protein